MILMPATTSSPCAFGEVVAVGLVLTSRGVPGERDTGAAVVALVAEDHRLHVHRGPEIVGDALHAPVVTRPATVPGLEHRLDGVGQLLERVVGEVHAGDLRDDALEPADETLEVRRGQRRVDGDAPVLHQVLERFLEVLTRDVEDDLAEHLHEASVRVVREALVVGLAGETLHRLVVEAEVEDGVHHPRHRERRPRADRDEQRVGTVTEALAHVGLERDPGRGDLVHQTVGQGVLGRHVRLARVRGDGEARRDRQTEVGHLGQVRPLAPEQVLLLLGALTEGIDVLHGCSDPLISTDLRSVPKVPAGAVVRS